MSQIGSKIYRLIEQLFPICRSITGEGVRQTLQILRKEIPLNIHEVSSGTKVFDWTVPQEWNIRDAYVKGPDGNRVIDFRQSNLHVVSGSQPIRQKMKWSELKSNLTTLPDYPDWIPYRTCFHQQGWGFCLSHNQFQQLESSGDVEYDVSIDATYHDGSLTYGELFLPGRSEQEMLLSAHVCHPSLANDNLSGIAIATELIKSLMEETREIGIRLVFLPATIGAITWLSRNQSQLHKIKYGLVLSLLGDKGQMTYKRTRQDDASINQISEYVLSQSGDPHSVREFEPIGYDERQYCSPGIDLPMGCLLRTPNGEFPEYHTSADNLSLISPSQLEDSFLKLQEIVSIVDSNRRLVNRKPYCEPQLGKLGLYRAFGSKGYHPDQQRAILWVLNQSDGTKSLLDIAQRSKIPYTSIRQAADALENAGVVAKVDPSSPSMIAALSTTSPTESTLSTSPQQTDIV